MGIVDLAHISSVPWLPGKPLPPTTRDISGACQKRGKTVERKSSHGNYKSVSLLKKVMMIAAAFLFGTMIMASTRTTTPQGEHHIVSD